MYQLTKFGYRMRTQIQIIGLFLLAIGMTTMLTGCAGLPAWLTSADQLLPLIATTFGTILSGIAAALGGNPALAAAAALITKLASTGEAAIKDIEAMVAEYKANPEPTLLTKIEEAAQAAIDNIKQLLTDVGLPAGIASVVQNLSQLILSQLEAWTKILPVLKIAETKGVMHARAALAAIPTAEHPVTAKAYAEKVNAILATSTGDTKIDAALAKIPRLQAA